MNQGDIYLINLDPTVHTEVGKTRPGMIISVNAMNHHSPRLIIAPITSSIGKIYPFEVFIPCGVGGLEKDSKSMLDQIRSLDKHLHVCQQMFHLSGQKKIAQEDWYRK
jgi:mRNA interferase MazF